MSTTTHFAQELDARVARFGLKVAASLSEANDTLPHDISERLRVARDQAMLRARSARAAQVQLAPKTVQGTVQMGATLALGGGPSPRWLKFASVLPLLMLVLGLALIQQSQWYQQINASAEVDTALLADHLPPAAYSDPGFTEYLSEEQQ
ncbi:DUF3619 family protein [Paucibacter sp. KCTC 42545]|uniref:DUF3619 family protein n=1 Tax=Paucibacter sp. KCTC 42545 TaxID=1768242 RepID=UPI000733A33F|nr:DUF3619 family protein [Paucibacter sp. KCTC 42545]ALT76504.1 hypothetical protein AT984_04115 [Paucibacter sp. KCTC 42545]